MISYCVFPNCDKEAQAGHAYCSKQCFEKFRSLESKKCPMEYCEVQVTKGHCFCGKEHAVQFRKYLNKQCFNCSIKVKSSFSNFGIKYCSPKCAIQDQNCCLPGCTKPKQKADWYNWNSKNGQGFVHYCSDKHAFEHIRYYLDDGNDIYDSIRDFKFLIDDNASTTGISQMCDDEHL